MTEDPSPLQPPDYRFLVGVGCLECRHLIDLVESTCEAFPEGIPLDILQDRVRHEARYPGDRGIHFEKV